MTKFFTGFFFFFRKKLSNKKPYFAVSCYVNNNKLTYSVTPSKLLLEHLQIQKGLSLIL